MELPRKKRVVWWGGSEGLWVGASGTKRWGWGPQPPNQAGGRTAKAFRGSSAPNPTPRLLGELAAPHGER